jgi:hypothetical protein
MSSGEFEQILLRNSNFMTVRRAGGGNGFAGFHCAITGKFVLGIGGGWLKEYSRMIEPKWACECYHPNAPKGFCKTGKHGTKLARGWRNILFELVSHGRVKASKEIVAVLGSTDSNNAIDKLFELAPSVDPATPSEYQNIAS